jgi:hypothetical protein
MVRDLARLGFQPGDFVVAFIAVAFFQGRRRACERALAPLRQPGDEDIRFPAHQLRRRTAQQPRHYGHLALNGKTLRPFPSTSEGAPSPALGERSGAPPGLRP